MQDFRSLSVWIKAHALAKNVHVVAGRMRGFENVVLRDRLFRAALSIPTNIVEGRAHESERQFARYLRIAFGSAMEAEYLVLFSADIELISEADFVALTDQIVEVKKMLTSLIKRLNQ